MTKKFKILILIAIIILPALMISIPKFIRCYGYYQLISETCSVTSEGGDVVEAGYLNTLSHKPVIVDFPKARPAVNFSIGYARFYIDPNTIRSIRVLESHTAVFIDCNDYHLGFLSPTTPSDMFSKSVKETAKLPNKAAKFLKLMTEDPFEAQVEIASACPMTYPQIFLMSEDSYTEYDMCCMYKTTLIHNQDGIGIFKTENIKGVIRFGTAFKPSQMLATIFSKGSNITQDIVVTSTSPEKSRQAITALLSSYSLLINNVPENSVLHKSILDSLSTQPKLILDYKN